jgi:putative restriction endonuclease
MARIWTRNETIQAFNLYCKTPFGRIHTRNPEIIKLAKRLDRTPSSVALKLANLARLDPALQRRNISGASHGSKMDVVVWNEFHQNWDGLAFESELLRSQLDNDGRLEAAEDTTEFPEGLTREAVVKARVNQQFFRAAVLAAYGNRCCITGLPMPELLVASHIVPWKVDATNRTNPRNGLCLNALHDKAFDLGLLTVTRKLTVVLAPELLKKSPLSGVREFFLKYKDASMEAPSRFSPDPAFLEYHNDTIFRRCL